MLPNRTLARARTPEGVEMLLHERDGVYTLRVDGYELMSSRAHGSEDALARIPCESIAGRPAPRVLVAGLGFGFTLRAALDHLPAGARVTVCEVLPALVEWNRTFVGDLAGHPLEDPRVRIVTADVGSFLAPRPDWDAILLDVDNGPEAFTLRSNGRLYGDRGVALLRDGLKPGGVLAVWSAHPSAPFERRLHRAGLASRTVKVAARGSGKGPLHYLFVARRKGKTGAPGYPPSAARGGRGKKAEVRRT